jgi:hypothetical protein
MSEHDKSLIDKAKDALGMGNDRQPDTGPEAVDSHHVDKDNLGVDGATQAAGASGAGGGSGASAALGGAGAGGPLGATPYPSDAATGPVEGTNVRTEYEMGHEFDPEHEKVAESGLFAERSGTAVVDTWRTGDEGTSNSRE